MNLSTCINTFSTTPLVTFTDLLISKRFIEVDFNSPRLRLLKIEYGSKFTLVSRSNNAFFNFMFFNKA